MSMTLGDMDQKLHRSAKDFRTPTLNALTASVAPIIGRSIATCPQHPGKKRSA